MKHWKRVLPLLFVSGCTAVILDGGDVGTEGEGPPPPPPPQGPADTRPPTVALTAPAAGATLSGTVTLSADASDDVGVAGVQFLIDGQSAGAEVQAAPYTIMLSTLALPSGAHTVSARARDAAGNQATAPGVAVTVANATGGGGASSLVLTANRVLTGSQSLDLSGGARRCAITGNGFSIVTSGTWTGTLRISRCDVRGLGTAARPGIDVTAAGAGQILIEDSLFESSGAIRVRNDGTSTTIFRRNTIAQSALPPVTEARYPDTASAPVFIASGSSTVQKLLQGNTFLKSWAQFNSTQNWLIGGDTDADSNVMIAPRAGLELSRCAGFTIRGNYLHAIVPSRAWSQMTTIDLLASGSSVVIEHNVLLGAAWVVRGPAGEVRYNVIGDFDGHNFIQTPQPGARIHHNLFIYNTPYTPYVIQEGINLLSVGAGVEVYNNTFDGGGAARGFFPGAIVIQGTGYLSSLRSNAITNFPFDGPAVRGGLGESGRPARLGYADHNLFYNPAARVKQNYGLSVTGKSEGQGGFGGNDAGGPNGQVNPLFRAPALSPLWSEAEVKARRTLVSQILASYRSAYTPQPGSPLIDRGDPADGAGNDIGAVGAGAAHPADRFAQFPK